MIDKITSLIIRNARTTCLLTLLITAGFIPFVLNLKVENTRGAFTLPDDDPVAKVVSRYDKIFGYEESLYLLIESDSVFDISLLNALHDFISKVRKVSGVTGVQSIFDARRVVWLSSLSGYRPKFVELFQEDGQNTIPYEEIREIVASQPLYNTTVSSPELKSLSVVINFKSFQLGGTYPAKERTAAVNNIIELLRPISDKYRLSMAGLPIIDRVLQQKLDGSLKLFCPLCILLIVVLMGVVFRRWLPVLLVTLLALITLTWSLGIMSLSGASISLTTVMIIPLIMTISAAYSIHYMDFYLRHYRPGTVRKEIFRRMLAVVLRPSLFCSLTTMIGFLALCTSELWVIRNLGFYMAIGVACCTVTVNIFFPALLYQVLGRSDREPSFLSRMSAVARSVSTRSFSNYRWVSLAVAGLVLAAAVGAGRLNLETNQLQYFEDREQIRVDYDRIDKKKYGTLPLDIIVTLPVDSLSARIGSVIRFRDSLEAVPTFKNSTSLFDFLELMERARPKMASPVRFPFDLKRNQFKKSFWTTVGESEDLRDFVRIDGDIAQIRIAGRLSAQGSKGLTEVLRAVDRIASKLLPGMLTEVSGSVPLFVRMQQYVVRTQILSLGISFTAVLVLFALISGCWKSGLAAVVANSLAVVVVLGIMGLCRIPLDVTTVMIAAVAIAIAADDTIHFLIRYKAEIGSGVTPAIAVDKVFRVIGSPVISTTVVLTLGFAALAFAEFMPIRYFGLLTGTVIVLALAADLVLVPALIHLVANKETKSSIKEAD